MGTHAAHQIISPALADDPAMVSNLALVLAEQFCNRRGLAFGQITRTVVADQHRIDGEPIPWEVDGDLISIEARVLAVEFTAA